MKCRTNEWSSTFAPKERYSKLDGLLFNNAVFYVMSGTGNTYRLGCWMREIADRYLDKTKYSYDR